MSQSRTSPTGSLRRDGLAVALFAGSPFERTMLTLGAGLILFLMFVVYRGAMRGLCPDRPVSSGHIARQAAGTEAELYLASADQKTRQALKYLPNTWVPTAAHSMATVDDRTYCYFQEWVKESPHVVKFTPFAMISTRKGDKPGDPPYTVLSDKAYVTFKDEFGPLGKNPGPVVRAGLEGNVVITGPNNVVVHGRNFFFQREEMRIYSDNPVDIKADKHHATAKGIQIELIAEHQGRSDEALSISGVSSVKLLQNVDMTLVSTGDSQAGPMPAMAKSNDKSPKIVRTHCDGSFVFYVESRIGNFERNVRIRRESLPGKFDALFADESVEITFEPKKPDPKTTADAKGAVAKADAAKKSGEDKAGGNNVVVAEKDTAAKDKKDGAVDGKNTPRGSGGLEPNLSFKSIHAQGKVVELTSDVNGMRSQMRDFTYDQTAREAKLVWIPREGDNTERTVRDKKGQVRKIPAASNCVWVTQRGNVLTSQKIQLNHDPQGEVTHVMCLGEGEMQHVEDKTGRVDLAAYWHKEMRKYPDPKSHDFDRIDLEDALIEQPKQDAGISANFIRLWLTRQNRGAQTVQANHPHAARQQPQPEGPHLDHMLAWQKVAMVSPQMECETDHLEVWFEDAPARPRYRPATPPRKRSDLEPTSDYVARGTPPVQSYGPAAIRFSDNSSNGFAPAGNAASVSSVVPTSVNGATSSNAAPSNGALTTKDSPNNLFPGAGNGGDPYNLTAGRVRVHVLQFPDGQQPQVADMLAWDNVQLTQAHGDAADPLVVNGNVLEAHNQSELDQEMIVLGQPAHVRDRGAHIEGGRIRFNRARNTADVDGPGRLQLPVQNDPEIGEAARPKNGEPAQPLDVVWHQKMHFDGKTAHFYVNVHTSMTDATSQSEIRCLNMDVTLTKPFSFTQQQGQQRPQNEADRPAVDTIFCQGDVEFESEAKQEGHLAEKRRGQFMDLVFHKLTGKCHASGPGQLRVWRHNEHGQSGIASVMNVQSNAPPKAHKSSAWEFNQVNFQGTMDGDFSDLMAGRSRPKSKSAPKIQPTAASSSILATNGAWSTNFYIRVEVIYGPVDLPMELVSRDDLSEDSGCLLCDSLQVTQHPQVGTVPQHIEMLARGNSRIEGKTFWGESGTITYDGSKSQYVLIGNSAGLARLWRQLKIGATPNTNAAYKIYFNPITHTVKEDAAQIFEISQ